MSVEEVAQKKQALIKTFQAGEDCVAAVSSLLVSSDDLSDSNQDLRFECQNLAFNALLHQILSSTDSGQLEDRCQRVENELRETGVPLGLAALARLILATQASQNGDLQTQVESLDRLQDVFGGDGMSPLLQARYWNLRAGQYEQQRRFGEALRACERFERNAPEMMAIARDQAALIALRIGDYGDARRMLETTRQFHFSAPIANNEAERINRLRLRVQWQVKMAKAMEGDQEFLPARAELMKAMDGLEKDKGQLASLRRMVSNNLALNHYLTGDFEKASMLFADANQDFKGEATIQGAEAKVNSGWISLAADDLDAADDSFAEAGRMFAELLSEQHPRYAEALTYRARASARQERIQEAFQWISKAERLVFERVCADLQISSSTRDRISIVQEARVHPESIAWPGTVDTYLELADSLNIPPSKQYELVLRWKGLVTRFDNHLDSDTREERQLHAKLREAYFRKVSILKRRQLKAEIESYETSLRELQRRKRVAVGGDLNLTSSLESITTNLQPGDVFLDIFQIRTYRRPDSQKLVGSARQYVGFLLDHRGDVKRLDLGPAQELDNAVLSWTKTILQRQIQMQPTELEAHLRQLKAAGMRTARIVQAPILSACPQIARLFVRGDAGTHSIPWAAVPGTGSKQYWIENIQIRVCDGAGPSANVELPAVPTLLAVGGVDFGVLSNRYRELKGSLEEKRLVVSRFRERFKTGVVVDLEQKQSNKTALRRSLPKCHFAHLATHGFFRRGDDANPFAVSGATSLLQTGLVLASGDDGTNDQYLTAAEIGELDLRKNLLVTLSACESSLGKSLAGQGVQGMFGSLHAAGAKRVIGTLWEIDDDSTVRIADRLYEYLWGQGMPPSSALRSAQLDMISNSQESLLAHPYAWAAFVCSEH